MSLYDDRDFVDNERLYQNKKLEEEKIDLIFYDTDGEWIIKKKMEGREERENLDMQRSRSVIVWRSQDLNMPDHEA